MRLSKAEYLRALQVLGMPPTPGFSAEDVRRYYLQTMRVWHPDKNPDLRVETDAYAKQINDARDTLLNWIKAGQPGWGDARPMESTPPSYAGASVAPASGPAPPDPAAISFPPTPLSVLQARTFAFYWHTGPLPHARILLVPLIYLLLSRLL